MQTQPTTPSGPQPPPEGRLQTRSEPTASQKEVGPAERTRRGHNIVNMSPISEPVSPVESRAAWPQAARPRPVRARPKHPSVPPLVLGAAARSAPPPTVSAHLETSSDSGATSASEALAPPAVRHHRVHIFNQERPGDVSSASIRAAARIDGAHTRSRPHTTLKTGKVASANHSLPARCYQGYGYRRCHRPSSRSPRRTKMTGRSRRISFFKETPRATGPTLVCVDVACDRQVSHHVAQILNKNNRNHDCAPHTSPPSLPSYISPLIGGDFCDERESKNNDSNAHAGVTLGQMCPGILPLEAFPPRNYRVR